MKIAIEMFLIIYIFSDACLSEFARKVPSDLLIGAATSAYQVEGAWNEDGKGVNIWDHMLHTHHHVTIDKSNGDVACDSYHKAKEDVALLKKLGFQYYRFSISWTRILPNGHSNVINKNGIEYYNDLINQLLLNGITPMVTIFHWDLPQVFLDVGGWTNPQIIKYFEDYARVIFDYFGDRVQLWITINEPKQVCQVTYGTNLLPIKLQLRSGSEEYMCTRNVLLAHASVFHLYNSEYKSTQKGYISLAIDGSWSEPSTASWENRGAAERRRQFEFGMYAHPIYSKNGDFPNVVKEFVANRSKAEGFADSRLPKFTKKEISFIRGTSDFFAFNYYTTYYVKDSLPDPIGAPSSYKDVRVKEYQDPYWLTGSFHTFRSVPWGFRNMLNYIKTTYGNPDIYITENGFPDWGELNDKNRIQYHKDHLHSVLDAVQYDGVRIKAYTVWSLMDNFEWVNGYVVKFGLYHVNFTNSNRTRTAKKSSKFFKDLIHTRTLIY